MADITGMQSAGRVLPLYKGEYDAKKTYTEYDVVLFENSSYVAKKATTGNEPPSIDLSDDYWQCIARGVMESDASQSEITFEESSELSELTSGEKLSESFGKIAKAISDYILHKVTVATETVLGHVNVDASLSSTSENPVQNKVIKSELEEKLTTNGDASNTTATFTESASLQELVSGEKHSVSMGKLKLVVKNMISIATLLGNTDISKIGNGTVTGAISNINSNLRANNAGNAVSLSKSDYIARSDGYVVAYTSDANSAVTVDVLDSQNGHFGSIRAVYANNTHGIAMVYVREGMIVRVSSSSGQYVAEFRPIV